jgi:hypothetical protein
LGKDTSEQAKQSMALVDAMQGKPTISDIPTIEHEQLSGKIFVLERALSRQFKDAGEDTNKQKTVIDKYAELWKEITAQEDFSSIIADMQKDTNDKIKTSFSTIENQNKPSPDVLQGAYTMLLKNFKSRIQTDQKLQKELLDILDHITKPDNTAK